MIYGVQFMISKLLIIEYEKHVAENLSTFLEETGYEVKIANTGLEGLRQIREFEPTLVLCNIVMPELDGFGVLKEMQRDSTIEEVPFIFLSACAEMTNLRKGMEMGADDFLVKPIEYNSLIRSVEASIIRFKNRKITTLDIKNRTRIEQLTENSTIFIMLDKHPYFIKVNQIAAISSSSQYTTLYLTDNRQVIFRKSLKRWEQTLPNSIFLRISRSTIINTNCISRVEKWLQFSYKIYISGIEKPFELSRRYASKIRRQI